MRKIAAFIILKCNDELHHLYNTSKQKAIDAKRDLLTEFFDTVK